MTNCGRMFVTRHGKLGIFEGNYFLDNCRKICPGGIVEFVQDFCDLSRISVTNCGKLGIFEGNYFLDNCRRICPGGTVESVQQLSSRLPLGAATAESWLALTQSRASKSLERPFGASQSKTPGRLFD